MLNNAVNNLVTGAEASPKIPQDDPPRSAVQEAWSEMERQSAAEVAEDLGPRLPLERLEEPSEAFWLRETKEHREYLVRELVQALRTRADLDPITVYICGRTVYVLDGHHRTEAYRREGRHDIPVVSFRGSPIEAHAEAVRRACKASAPLTQPERSNAAWRCVLSGGFKQREVVELTTISARTVATMVKVRRELGDAAIAHASWWRARKAWQEGVEEHRALTDEEWAEHDQAQGENLAATIFKAVGPRLQKNPRAAAIAVALLVGQKGTQFAEEFCGQEGVDWPPDYDDEDDNDMF